MLKRLQSIFGGKLSKILILFLLTTAIPLTVIISQKQQETRQHAAEIASPMTEEEKKVAGLDADGKLNADRAKDLALLNPKMYQQLVSQGLVAKPDEVKNPARLQGGGGATPTPLPPLTPPNIIACGDITQSGDYALTQDITADDVCISIHDTQNVNLDCQNHTIASTYSTYTGFSIALDIMNVQNFSIKNCTIQSVFSETIGGNSSPINILNSNSGTIQNNNILKGIVNVSKTNNLQVSDNTFNNGFYRQAESSYNQIYGNKFKKNLTDSLSVVVNSYKGNNNTIKNNTIDGSWDGVYPNRIEDYVGADDGIVIENETNDIISQNIISNNYDCGIETVGTIKDTQIIGNTIKNSGLCGIGGWHGPGWLHNTIDANIVDGAPYMFMIFRVYGTFDFLPYAYFKDNTFTNNVFLHQRNIASAQFYSSWIDFQNISSQIPPSGIQIGNNVFKNNDFGATLPAPVIMPASMIVDQGGNKCLATNDEYIRPLACQNVASPSATPTPIIVSPVSFGLNPNIATASAGQTFTVGIGLNNNANYAISGVDVNLSFDNAILTLQSFTPSSFLNSKLTNSIAGESGTLHYVAVETLQPISQQTYNLGTLTFVGRNPGIGNVNIQNAQITAIGIPGAIPTANNDQGSYTVSQAPAPVCSACAADVDKNGVVNVVDFSYLLSCFGKSPSDTNIAGKPCAPADINGDGLIDNVDYSCLQEQFGKRCTTSVTPSASPTQTPVPTIAATNTPIPVVGDANGDGLVNILDYNIWRDEFLGILTTKKSDFNHDSIIDLLDFNIWRNAFNTQ